MIPNTAVISLSEPSACHMADEWYKLATSDHFWMKWRHDIFCKYVSRDHLNGPVFEVGCGAGVARKMIEDDYSCTIDGCDLNLVALEDSVPVKGETYFYNVQDRKEEFHEKFSTIVLLDVLEHIEDPILFLESIYFHLRTGGTLIVNVPAFQPLYSQYDVAAGHVRRYNRKTLTKELNQTGLIVKDSSYWGMSLIPLLLLRKIVLIFFQEKKVINTGFNPRVKIIDCILQGLRVMETKLFFKVPFGTSLFAVAQKEEKL